MTLISWLFIDYQYNIPQKAKAYYDDNMAMQRKTLNKLK
jgi:hypothetical protein